MAEDGRVSASVRGKLCQAGNHLRCAARTPRTRAGDAPALAACPGGMDAAAPGLAPPSSSSAQGPASSKSSGPRRARHSLSQGLSGVGVSVPSGTPLGTWPGFSRSRAVWPPPVSPPVAPLTLASPRLPIAPVPAPLNVGPGESNRAREPAHEVRLRELRKRPCLSLAPFPPRSLFPFCPSFSRTTRNARGEEAAAPVARRRRQSACLNKAFVLCAFYYYSNLILFSNTIPRRKHAEGFVGEAAKGGPTRRAHGRGA